MEESREYISYDVVDNGSDFIEHHLESDYIAHSINSGNEFLMHYGVKGMKWHQHKKKSDSIAKFEAMLNNVEATRKASGAVSRSALSTGANRVNNSLKKNKRTQVGSAVLKGLGNRYPKEAARRTGRTALYKGLSSNTKVRESFQKAERKRIDRSLAKKGSRTVRGQKLIAQKRLIKKLPNGKVKKAAMKKWTLDREAFYESL